MSAVVAVCHNNYPSVVSHSFHSNCGLPNPAFPDGWSNEEWYGLFSVALVSAGSWQNNLHPRPVYFALQAEYAVLAGVNVWARAAAVIFIFALTGALICVLSINLAYKHAHRRVQHLWERVAALLPSPPTSRSGSQDATFVYTPVPDVMVSL